jgi:hypothetical protein
MITTVPNPKYVPMSEIRSKLYLIGCLTDHEKKPSPNIDEQFLIQILNKRIEVLKLPISFSDGAKNCILALTDRPGSVMALLVDCLNNFEGQTVTSKELADLYPMGFYDEETMLRYIDEYLKPRKIKWAEIY